MDQVEAARNHETGALQAEARLKLLLDQKSVERNASNTSSEAIRMETISQVKGADAARYHTLKDGASKSNDKLTEAFQQIDSTLERLDITRTELRVERQLAKFQQIAAPAAERINAYLKDTAREEGIKSVVEPLRHQAHVERIALTILQTAKDYNVQLDHSPDGLAQVHSVTNNLFDNLRDGLARANEHLLQGRQLIAEPYRSDQLMANQPTRQPVDNQHSHLLAHDRLPSQGAGNLDKNTTATPDRTLDLTPNPEPLQDNPFYEQDLTNSSELNQLPQTNNGGSQATALTQNQQTQGRELPELDLIL
jgi:hypothetical protein